MIGAKTFLKSWGNRPQKNDIEYLKLTIFHTLEHSFVPTKIKKQIKNN